MFRNLIIIIAVVALIWIVRGFIRRGQLEKKPPSGNGKDMVQCEQCQTYLPRDDAIEQNDHFFCGQKHLQEWKRDH